MRAIGKSIRVSKKTIRIESDSIKLLQKNNKTVQFLPHMVDRNLRNVIYELENSDRHTTVRLNGTNFAAMNRRKASLN